MLFLDLLYECEENIHEGIIIIAQLLCINYITFIILFLYL